MLHSLARTNTDTDTDTDTKHRHRHTLHSLCCAPAFDHSVSLIVNAFHGTGLGATIVGGRVYTTVVRHAGSTANMANGSPTSEGGAVRRLIDMCDSVSKDSILAR